LRTGIDCFDSNYDGDAMAYYRARDREENKPMVVYHSKFDYPDKHSTKRGEALSDVESVDRFCKKRERTSVSDGENSEGSDDEEVVLKDIVSKEYIA
jgi:hypothetical protein